MDDHTPHLFWHQGALATRLAELAHAVGRYAGRLDALGMNPENARKRAGNLDLTRVGDSIDVWLDRLTAAWLPDSDPEPDDNTVVAADPVATRMTQLAALIDVVNREIENLDNRLHKERFKARLAGLPLNRRQLGMLDLLMHDFPKKLTSTKWARITRCSPDTALRDISDLVNHGVLARDAAGGRSTSYQLVQLI
jgi:hypothetical protein